jgi:hypothetical protein
MTSAFIAIMFLISALLEYFKGYDTKFSCGVSLFFAGIMLVCRQIEISIKNSNKQTEANK